MNENLNYQENKSLIPLLEGVEANITSSGDFFDGYNLFELTEIKEDSDKKRTLLIVSMKGDILAEMKDYQHPAKFLTPNTVLIAKNIGNEDANAVLWNISDNSTEILDFFGHHDFEWNPNNETYFAFLKYRIEIDGQEYCYDTINEYTKTGELVWSLDTRSFIPPSQWCPFQDLDSGSADMTHSNSIFFDTEEDVFYYNPRNPNTFYKIDHKTGVVLWGLGEYGNFTLFDLHGKQKESLFYHPHALEKIDENTFILFDNNFHNQIGNFNARNRMLEITIDEKTMTANESWAWTAPREYYSAVLCDADRLPNGNRLGTFGMNQHPNSNIGARIVEVNDTGHIVWEMNFPNKEEISYRIYHVDRVRFNPILSPTPDIRYKENNLFVTWQTWYNFRTNRQVTEPYTIYLNDKPIYNGTHIFDKFWRPTNLTVNLGNLELGTHRISVIFTELNNTLVTNTFVQESTSGFDLFIIAGILFIINIRMLIHRRRERKK
ncbi:MAG: aryl-sulfate sulfotransferase [Candidatus Hodarchaeales archaeon]